MVLNKPVRACQTSHYIFVLPPSIRELEARLKKRRREDDVAIKRRMQEVKNELAHYDQADYIVVNDDFSNTLSELKRIHLGDQRRAALPTERYEPIGQRSNGGILKYPIQSLPNNIGYRGFIIIMARLTIEDCLTKINNRYDLTLLAGKRARQLALGKKALVEENNDKPVVIALREIAAGLITPENINTIGSHNPLDDLKMPDDGELTSTV